MTRPVRPVASFVLRLWREPGTQQGDSGWRGLISLLGDQPAAPQAFHGLDNLLEALRAMLPVEEARPSEPPLPPPGSGS